MLVVVFVVTALLVVWVGLVHRVLVTRPRRELDRYLCWLLENTAGPLSVAPPYRWR